MKLNPTYGGMACDCREVGEKEKGGGDLVFTPNNRARGVCREPQFAAFEASRLVFDSGLRRREAGNRNSER